MKNVELKNCPNCHERIGVQDVECPYCKYIDDPKYQKQNMKRKKKKKKRKNDFDIYEVMLFVPIVFYLIYLLIDIKLSFILIPLILLNVMCFFIKKKKAVLGVIIIEIITLLFNFINNFNDVKNLKMNIVVLFLGIIFLILPKIIYINSKNKKIKNYK